MPIKRVSLDDAISKSEFHSRLRAWLHDTGDAIVGEPDVPGVTAWVHVLDGSSRYRLHADTRRKAVDDYLRLVAPHGDDLKWTVVASKRGRINAVAYGPERKRLVPFYLYLVDANVSSEAGISRPATEADIEGLRYEIVTMTTKRSRRLRESAFKNAKGVCAVCQRDFSKVLGGRGARVLQVHHTRMISKRKTESVTKLSDLVVVCANCHLLLHLDHKTTMSVAALRKLLRADE